MRPDGRGCLRAYRERMSAFWHPFAAMHSVRDSTVTITRGEDVWVFDDAGTRYLDATASLWYANVGHGRREIVDAVAAQMYELEAYSTFTDFANEPALRLADEIAARAPLDGGKVFFTSGGGDSIETAAKLAREYFAAVGEPQRTVLLHREHSYHGTHGLGTSLAGIPGNRLGAPFTPDVVQTPWDDAAGLEKAIVDVGPERVAAFFCEPVIGAGGVLPPPEGYIEAAAEVCRRHGVLFVADAVICGFGRLGNWFGIEKFGVRPDIAVFAKGVTSGYQPLGGIVASGRVAAPFWDEPGRVFRHGQTYAGHPAACAAGSATIALMEREGLLERADALAPQLLERLQGIADHPLVAHARGGVGVLGALALDPERLAATPDLPQRVFRAARERGVLIRPMGSAIGYSPPLTVTAEHLDLLAEATRAGLDDVAAAL
ncbi:Adenosylmethionine-8-amino-7-oxononanoate aminotransferase [Pseudonocardia ammonioxydans]|uniref:Adenosylmethionine-8-amino-7-oxononanoate aminotransferase n=2 Tax=Pseudonocardia ammonioxydans TaxID=260086 RepID=A0A1I5CXE8_PSUAM|nr:Adenosylmethionine-8-amino-7-oxononanoate aminotransferase [Pseudonocardia ammonioxydans]